MGVIVLMRDGIILLALHAIVVFLSPVNAGQMCELTSTKLLRALSVCFGQPYSVNVAQR